MGLEAFLNMLQAPTASSDPFGFMRNAKSEALSALQPQQSSQNVLAQIGQSLLGTMPQAPTASTAEKKPVSNMIRMALGLPPSSGNHAQSSSPEMPKPMDISSPNLDEQTKQQTIAQMLRGLG